MRLVSLIDPNEHRRKPARTGRRWQALMVTLPVGGAATGYGLSIFGDYSGTYYSFGLDEPGALVKVLLLMAGCSGVIFALGAVTRLPRTSKLRSQPAFLVGITALAAAAGQFAGTLLPASLSAFDEADLASARTAVRLQSAGLVVVALLLIGWGVRAARRVGLRAMLRTSGKRSRGVVTDARRTGVRGGNKVRILLTVRFPDADGVQRFIRHRMTVSRLSVPAEGDRIPVWFDLKDPGNERKIVVGAED